MAQAIEYSGPKLTHEIDVERYLRACPPHATTRGTFFKYVREAVEKKIGADPRLLTGLTNTDWMAFRKYPLREFMQLSVNAARIAHGEEAISEGLRRVGWLAFPSFAATMAGRVVLFAFGERLENVVSAMPKAYLVAVPGTVVETEELGARLYRVTMRNVYNFVDTYHLGVLEGAVLAMGYQPLITVEVGERPCDAVFEGGW
jgi:uncharacterized protein (TIGR02265 family)